MDAALQWSDGKFYFFKDERFWLYNDILGTMDPESPKETTVGWLGCTQNNELIPLVEL